MTEPLAGVGVIGGSGFYELLDDAELVAVDTPYGAPSGPLTVGEVGGVAVAFLPRHGPRHEVPPHRVNYRANLWALHSVGVRRVLAPCATGSLRAELEPGHLVVVDQFIDRTWGRADTFFDGPDVHHVSLADPYCAELGAAVAAAARAEGVTVHEGGAVVVIQGPRFSTRAESEWFRSMGASVVNMTQYPEVALARELGMCFAGAAFVTDYDSGVEGRDDVAPVTMEEILAVLAANVDTTRALLARAIPSIATTRTCGCADGAPRR